ncbi:MAG: Hpt domain-containing protein, partial [Spirochaetaceae bacterium]|nr:Hpt domain-containing protein [Spirochaetaceae bacterium]
MSDYLDPNNEELLKDFFSEAQMQVDTLEQNILSLENDSGNRDAVDEIFRAAHTLKGGAATVEMEELAHFTHLVEDVLDAIRSDKLTVTEDVVDILLSAIDIVKEMLGKRMEGDVYKSDTSEIEGKLHSLLPEKGGAKVSAKPPAPVQAKPAAVSAQAASGGDVKSVSVLSEDEARELTDAGGGLPVYQISVKFDETSLMNTVGGIQIYTAIKHR